MFRSLTQVPGSLAKEDTMQEWDQRLNITAQQEGRRRRKAQIERYKPKGSHTKGCTKMPCNARMSICLMPILEDAVDQAGASSEPDTTNTLLIRQHKQGSVQYKRTACITDQTMSTASDTSERELTSILQV